MDKLLEVCNLPKLNQKESENLNRQITTNEIDRKEKSPKTQSPGTDDFNAESKQTFKE